MHSRLQIVEGDNLNWLQAFPDACVDLIYIDPPFNTGTKQSRARTRSQASEDGYKGFGGRSYKRVTCAPSMSYADQFSDYMDFLCPRLVEAHRVLAEHGSLFLHLDYREVHYAKVFLDSLFGRACFKNEIIWSYDFGARSKSRWSAKHDNILWYTKHPKHYTYNYDAIDRIPYMAPGLVGPEKAARGKTPTDVWWHTIVSPTGKEKTGYPTQKPLGILNRIMRVHSNPGDLVLDFFAGSGSVGESALELQRNCILIDQNPQAIQVMQDRLQRFAPVFPDDPSRLCFAQAE